MNSAVSWALLGAALLIAPITPRGTAPAASGPARAARTGPRQLPIRMLRPMAAGATALLCVLLLGIARGGLVAVALAPGAAFGTGRLAGRTSKIRQDTALALTLDLMAAALRGGQPLASALVLAAPAAHGTVSNALTRVGGLLRLGADPAEAWGELAGDPVLASVAGTACRSAHSGVRLAGAFEQLAADTRAQLRTAAQARAERVGVIAMAPLALCFLPAFVCLGVVPVVVGVAKGVFTGLP